MPPRSLPRRPRRAAGTVYLTLDTGNMRDAELIAGILRKHDVKATFFLANERTPRGDRSLDDAWAGYWRRGWPRGMRSAATPSITSISAASADGAVRGAAAVRRRGGRARCLGRAAVCAELARVVRRSAR
jgi:peptidoglycan/xylan/chitin deacetylase (PgdA/CDA1 family)